jgi:hypothetical protein
MTTPEASALRSPSRPPLKIAAVPVTRPTDAAVTGVVGVTGDGGRGRHGQRGGHEASRTTASAAVRIIGAPYMRATSELVKMSLRNDGSRPSSTLTLYSALKITYGPISKRSPGVMRMLSL